MRAGEDGEGEEERRSREIEIRESRAAKLDAAAAGAGAARSRGRCVPRLGALAAIGAATDVPRAPVARRRHVGVTALFGGRRAGGRERAFVCVVHGGGQPAANPSGQQRAAHEPQQGHLVDVVRHGGADARHRQPEEPHGLHRHRERAAARHRNARRRRRAQRQPHDRPAAAGLSHRKRRHGLAAVHLRGPARGGRANRPGGEPALLWTGRVHRHDQGRPRAGARLDAQRQRARHPRRHQHERVSGRRGSRVRPDPRERILVREFLGWRAAMRPRAHLRQRRVGWARRSHRLEGPRDGRAAVLQQYRRRGHHDRRFTAVSDRQPGRERVDKLRQGDRVGV